MPGGSLKDWLLQDPEHQWGLQVMLDTLALGENIPARLISLTSISQLYEHIQDSYQYLILTNQCNTIQTETLRAEWFQFQQRFPGESYFNRWVRDELDRIHNRPSKVGVRESYYPHPEIIRALSRWVLITLPSNELPIENLIRIELVAWEWLVILWLYHLYQQKHLINGSHENAFGIPHFCIRLHPIPLNIQRTVDITNSTDKLYLMQGPIVFGQSSLFSEQAYDEEIVDKIVKAFRNIVEYFLDSRNFSATRFSKAIKAEPALPQKNAERRGRRLRDALDKILDFSLSPTQKIDAQCLRLMSFWGLVHTQRHEFLISQTNITPEIRIDMLYESDTRYNRQHSNLIFEAYHNHNDFFLSSRTNPHTTEWTIRSCHYGANLNIFPLTEANQKTLEEFAVKLGHSFLRIDQKTKLHEQKELLIFTEWLQSRIGTLSNGKANISTNYLKHQHNHYQRSSEQICQWIAESMRADLCMLFSYQASSGQYGRLVALNSYSRSAVSPSCREQMEQDMHDIASTPKNREQSISYRTVQGGVQRVCYSYDKKTGTSIPEGESLYRSSATQAYMPPYRMVISTPIKFNNRLLGIIEISSAQSYRFRYNRQTVLKRIASALSPFLYQQEYLLSLHEIQMDVLKFHRRANRGNERDLYNGICKAMSRLFLSDGVSLWIRDATETNEFYCKGVFNDSLLPNAGEGIHYDINDTKFRTGKHLKSISNTDSNIKEIAHENLEDGKPLEGHHKHLHKQEITSINIIPIPSSQEDKYNAIASLNIYNRGSDVRYDDAWLGIAQFASSHLSLIIGAVKAFEAEELMQENIHTHELWHDIQVVADKAGKIARQNHFLRGKLESILRFANNDWFKNQLETAKLVGVIDQKTLDKISSSHLSIRDNQQRTKILQNELGQALTDEVNIARHGLETNLFLPLEDILYLKGLIKTRTSVLLDKRGQENPEYQRVLLISGRHDIARFTRYAREKENINLTRLYNTIIAGNKLRDRRGIRIQFTEPTHRRSIIASPHILHTMMSNLLINAVKYSASGYQVDIMFDLIEGDMMSLTIINTGYSMETPNEHKRVIAYKVRGSNTKHCSESGLGMGLFIVDQVWRHIVGGEFIFKELPLKNGKSRYIAELIFPYDEDEEGNGS